MRCVELDDEHGICYLEVQRVDTGRRSAARPAYCTVAPVTLELDSQEEHWPCDAHSGR
jgi:hypothetical protein